MKRHIALALSLLMLLSASTTGCIGRMAVSGEVQKFNLNVTPGKWGRWVVFLVLYVIPVYPLAHLVDLLVVNSLEFWQGTNPVSGESRLAWGPRTRVVEGADGSRGVSTLREDGSIDIEITEPDGEKHSLNLSREDGSVVARDASGAVLGRMDAKGALHRDLPAS